MQDLIPRAERAGCLLKDRRETIVVAESSTGGLISAARFPVVIASKFTKTKQTGLRTTRGQPFNIDY